MAETALTADEANALSGTTDGETALVYPSIGESTYYATFYRMLQRLLTMGKVPGNEFRVYKDGDLTCGVRAAEVQIGPTALAYAGCAAQALANNQTNYVFLTAANLAAGDAVTINSTGFPTDGSLCMPLATILTSGGVYAYTDVTDYRGRALWNPPGSLGRMVEENTAGSGSPNILIAAESGKVLINLGSTATNYHTLPAAAPGLTFTFIRTDASDELRVVAAAGDKIVIGTDVSVAAGYIESTARWDAITLIALGEEYWIAHPATGTWTIETV